MSPHTSDPLYHTLQSQPHQCYICDNFLPRANMVAVTSPSGAKVICRSCMVNLNAERAIEAAKEKHAQKGKART